MVDNWEVIMSELVMFCMGFLIGVIVMTIVLGGRDD